MKMSSRYHRLLIYDVKRTTKIDGMGPFKNHLVSAKCLPRVIISGIAKENHSISLKMIGTGLNLPLVEVNHITKCFSFSYRV